MHCPACGVEVVEQAVYCHKCGERLPPAENGPPGAARPAEAPKPAAADVPVPAAPARRDSAGGAGNGIVARRVLLQGHGQRVDH